MRENTSPGLLRTTSTISGPAGTLEPAECAPVTAWLATRLYDGRDELEARWRAACPAGIPRASDHIMAIVESLRQPPEGEIERSLALMRKAAALGAIRFIQGASVPQVLHEYQLLADLLEEFLLDEVRQSGADFAVAEIMGAMRSVTQSVRVLQHQTVEALIRKYLETIERQGEQLTAFGRVVGHEIRQPLGVLRLMCGVVPIREGDVELTHLMDVFDRNIRRLALAAARLERLSHDGLDGVVLPDLTVGLDPGPDGR